MSAIRLKSACTMFTLELFGLSLDFLIICQSAKETKKTRTSVGELEIILRAYILENTRRLCISCFVCAGIYVKGFEWLWRNNCCHLQIFLTSISSTFYINSGEMLNFIFFLLFFQKLKAKLQSFSIIRIDMNSCNCKQICLGKVSSNLGQANSDF